MSIQNDVDRGAAIILEMARLKKELDIITERLEAAALHGEQIPLKDAERGGRQYLAHGSRITVPVIITDDKLMGSFSEGTPAHTQIVAALGSQADRLPEFFKRNVTFKNLYDDGKKFRADAVEVLGKLPAPAFITACIARSSDGLPKNDIKICWADAVPKEVV